MPFRDDFSWGAATAAYQIEGAHQSDGKGPSVWDQISHWPGKVYLGDTGDVACDHYNRLEEDLDLMKQLGLKAYRFSFSWPRVLPEGVGTPNEKGLAFYDRLIDGLLERGIQPWGTLFHWDYPLALYRRGGWLNPQSPQWFANYATLLAQRFGDRVQNWMTLNEPQIFIGLGHQVGVHAPALQYPSEDIATMIHHVLLAHGKSAQVLRTQAQKPATIGWAPAIGPVSVAREQEGDSELVELAREANFGFDVTSRSFANSAAVWCDPVFLGHYPTAFTEALGHALPKGWENDLGVIATPIDFNGLNIYASWEHFERGPDGKAVRLRHNGAHSPGHPRTLFGWPVTPGALYWGPKFFYERYGSPIVITENGLSCMDWVALDGQVHDPQRIDFTTRYLRELRRAAEAGTDVRGYFHWSLMDNFEWAEGYKHRFGLIYVDYLNGQKRTVKDSGCWYRGVIESNGAKL
ncbi:MAG: GH1 family beta-glucosidase [Opitutales bacterium]